MQLAGNANPLPRIGQVGREIKGPVLGDPGHDAVVCTVDQHPEGAEAGASVQQEAYLVALARTHRSKLLGIVAWEEGDGPFARQILLRLPTVMVVLAAVRGEHPRPLSGKRRAPVHPVPHVVVFTIAHAKGHEALVRRLLLDAELHEAPLPPRRLWPQEDRLVVLALLLGGNPPALQHRDCRVLPCLVEKEPAPPARGGLSRAAGHARTAGKRAH
mmetsp:Transcript_17595/g.44283  ORF Transcript_17595/g.44283 Transcript_17595/m.44283 type:complete len:215 (-) Transcript_17595:33-677(-)